MTPLDIGATVALLIGIAGAVFAYIMTKDSKANHTN